MRRLVAIAIALTFYARAASADSPALTIDQQLVPSPAPVGATAPTFSGSPGSLAMSWLEPDSSGQSQRLLSLWLPAENRWSPPRPITPDDIRAIPPAPPGIPEVRFPDGSGLKASFPEKDGRILDLHTQRLHGKFVGPLRPLSSASWPADYAGTVPEPPQLHAYDNRAIAVWLNYAEQSPRLFAALSTDAGEQFLLPVRIDDGRPSGRASLVFLQDRSAYLSWVELHGRENGEALWLRRLSSSGDLSVPVLIATSSAVGELGHPQLASLKDYDTSPAQLMLAHEISNAGFVQIVTRLITLPPLESFSAGRPCLTCPPDSATLPGYSLKGSDLHLGSENGTIEFSHSGIPGILAAGQTTFRSAKKLVGPRSRSFVARVEKRDGVWHLLDLQAVPDRQPHPRP